MRDYAQPRDGLRAAYALFLPIPDGQRRGECRHDAHQTDRLDNTRAGSPSWAELNRHGLDSACSTGSICRTISATMRIPASWILQQPAAQVVPVLLAAVGATTVTVLVPQFAPYAALWLVASLGLIRAASRIRRHGVRVAYFLTLSLACWVLTWEGGLFFAPAFTIGAILASTRSRRRPAPARLAG